MRRDFPLFHTALLAALVLLVVTGCRVQHQEQPIPTLAVLPSAYSDEGAERAAREFLQRWLEGDYEAMYGWITFTSQEATPRQAFIDFYTSAAETMGLTRVSYTPSTLRRQSDELAVFRYDVTFMTESLGEFSDTGRDLQVVVDSVARDWRVAWTRADLFPEMADGGQLRLARTIPNRANIYGADGGVLADQNGRVVSVGIIRRSIPSYGDCLNALSAALAQPVGEVQARLEARPADWLVEIGVIEAQTYLDTNAVLAQFCDARFDDRPARRYPSGALAAHLLGYVGYPTQVEVADVEAAGFAQDSILGRSGVELAWDTTLRGTPSAALTIVNPAGDLLRELASSRAQPGQSLWLTLDLDLQRQVYQIVADAYTQAKDSWAQESRGAAVVLMDVHTGAIYASVSFPSFDNNAYTPFPIMGRTSAQEQVTQNQADARRPELNRVTQGIYPLGSVMKTVSAAAAADSGVYALDERYTCSGLWTRDINRVDWLAGGHGTLNLAGALTNSCNPYFYEVGYQLSQVDNWLLPNYSRQLGFGAPTGITDILEDPGLIPDPDWLRETYGLEWTFSDEVNMSIGQGYVQVTPLQVARWFSAIANGGDLPTPHLVAETGLIGQERTPAYTPEMTPTNLSPDVLAVIQEGLCAVTTAERGTAEFVFRNSPLQGLGVCGKTGTAQDPPRNSHAWFAAYAPREQPEVAVVVIVENSGEGSGVAAPIARQVLEAYFGLLP